MLGIEAYLLNAGQAALLATLKLNALFFSLLELGSGGNTGLDFHGEVDFFRGGQQRNFADFLEVHTHRVAREHGNRGIGGTTASACTSAGGVHLGQSGNSARLNGFQLFLGDAFKQILVFERFVFFIFDDIVSGKRDVVDGFLGFILLYGRISFGSRHRCYPFAVKRA